MQTIVQTEIIIKLQRNKWMRSSIEIARRRRKGYEVNLLNSSYESNFLKSHFSGER